MSAEEENSTTTEAEEFEMALESPIADKRKYKDGSYVSPEEYQELAGTKDWDRQDLENAGSYILDGNRRSKRLKNTILIGTIVNNPDSPELARST